MGVLASADNPVSHGASGFCRWEKQLYYAKKHSRRVHLWLCFVFSCLLLRGLDMERQHISRSYMGYLICHHSGSLPCRYVGIPTAVVSGLTLNMAFSIYLPYRFSAIYFSAMWTATAPSTTLSSPVTVSRRRTPVSLSPESSAETTLFQRNSTFSACDSGS